MLIKLNMMVFVAPSFCSPFFVFLCCSFYLFRFTAKCFSVWIILYFFVLDYDVYLCKIIHCLHILWCWYQFIKFNDIKLRNWMFGDFIAQSDGFYYLLIFRLVIFILHFFAQSLSNFIDIITVLITHVFLGQHKMTETNI